jgi:protein gp37
MAGWNPWHGCHKLSAGCANCYVYRIDARHERDSSIVKKNAEFNLPVRRGRDGEYKIKPGEVVYTCFTSDFLLEDADAWRTEAWRMMRERSDLIFFFITKRIDRFMQCIPADWGDGYENVHICCTCENQAMADYRLPIFRAAPIRHKSIILEPMLGPVALSPYLGGWVEDVTVGGESGPEARWCDYTWVLDIRRQCVEANIAFYFRQTGARFIKDGKRYNIPRRLQHAQARKANIDFIAD